MTRCEQCIWNEQCGGIEPCGDFTPAEQNYEKMIENGRSAFREEWAEYISELAD